MDCAREYGVESVTSMGEDLFHAFTEVNLQRVHTTIAIEDFASIREDVVYIVHNKGNREVSILSLPPRERRVQRNLKVEDPLGRKLVYVPLSISSPVLRVACELILESANLLLNDSQKMAFKEIKDDIELNLSRIFMYEPEKGKIESSCKQISKILEEKILWKEDFVRKIIPLADLLYQYKRGLYRPLVALSKPLKSGKYTMVYLSVEKTREYILGIMERLKFGIFGRFTFSYKPVFHKGMSNHLRIHAPPGLCIKDVVFDIADLQLEDADQVEENSDQDDKAGISPRLLETKINENKKEYFDDRCFYIHVSPEKSTALHNFRTYFNIKFKLDDLLFVLTLLWWLTILSPSILGILSYLLIIPSAATKIVLSGSFVLALLGFSATFLVAISIYAIDKKILKYFITTHIILVYSILILEILFIIAAIL